MADTLLRHQRISPDRNNAGGHDLFAGGRIEIRHLQEAEIDILEIRLSQRFAELPGYKNADWKP